MSKKELRAKLLKARQSLGRAEFDTITEQVNKNLNMYLSDKEFETVHCFEPINSLAELDVISLFEGKKLFTSRKIDGAWQIVAVNGQEQVPAQFDLIIVPMLGFDNTLNRIGYGGGYYDKFLSNQPKALKVGVCLEQCRVEKLPVESHDIPLDAIITDNSKVL